MTPDQIIATARGQLRTPFRHQGRLPGVALDCAGLVIHIARELGIKHADQPGYNKRPSGGMLELALDNQPGMVRVSISDMRLGDVLLMRFQTEPQHLAIFTGENIIHTWQVVGKVCEHRLNAEWRTRIVRVYRFIGVEHGE